MKRLTLGVSAAVLMLAGAALAAEDHGPAAPQSETRAEAQTRAAALFDKLDVNHDGKLDQADRVARTSQMFDRLDTNHDGVISRDEFAAAHQHGHKDHDHHGWDHHGHDHQGSDHQGPDHRGPGLGGADHPGGGGEHAGGHMGHGGHGHGEMRGLVWLIMQRADPNHSGTVTRDAFIRAALALFDQADTNHDGVLTPDEHRAAAQAMRHQQAARWQQHGASGDVPPPSPPPTH